MTRPGWLDAGEGQVRPEWLDYNGHMNLAYYVVLFDAGADVLFERIGFDHAYRTHHRCGPFAAETHTLYENELILDDRVRLSCRVLGADAKRLHIAHEMHRVADGVRAAAQEVMYLHVDLRTRRVAPFHEPLADSVARLAAEHGAAGPPPDWTGRRVRQL